MIKMDKPVINLNQFDALRQINPAGSIDFLKKLIAVYSKSAPALLAQIENATQAGDNLILKRAAHTLKSSAANIGAEALADVCKKLEDLGSNNQIDEASKLLAELHHEFRQVTVALEKLSVELDAQ